ncbi:PHD and RING finger domain-containing protein [Erysiphe necator]|uniref:Putative fyve phd zinc finger n=1 Tax=Uncinula necator TaxID=52586 RepID=A0A0B1P8Z6_UNCNE|nr:PHD and RING finger domain-containing protein [Erysiphe necator]KHJ33421.1 putative fyve phd zinc finger [Erysiphe necator]
MEDLDQECIICTLNLDVVPTFLHSSAKGEALAGCTELPGDSHPCKNNDLRAVAVIKPCNHFLHNHCLQEWSQISNTCPLCRQSFNLVEVLDTVNGAIISSYTVKDKKQEATLDLPTWTQDDNEEDEADPCPICNESRNPEVLILCDACDANYHTYCVCLDDVPLGNWFCMECADIGAYTRAQGVVSAFTPVEQAIMPRPSRTQAGRRRNRRRLRNDSWFGPWNQIGHRIHGATGLDIDFSEDEEIISWRRLNQDSVLDETQRNIWRMRMNIARQQDTNWSPSSFIPRTPTPIETIEETKAWGDFEKAKNINITSPMTKKRKPRSIVASSSTSTAAESSDPEPQRKLKRPRTRKVLDRAESSSSAFKTPISQSYHNLNAAAVPGLMSPDANDEPSFLTSLLREVNTASGLDDTRSILPATTKLPHRVTSPQAEPSSPLLSPASSSSSYFHSRITSRATPSQIHSRSLSPLPLTSRIEPVFSPIEYPFNRIQRATSEEISQKIIEKDMQRQLPPDKKPPIKENPLTSISPARATLSSESKRDINQIVKSVLEPYWRSAEITKEQYGCINRDVSRKLYETLANHNLDDQGKDRCKMIATAQVAIALESLMSK